MNSKPESAKKSLNPMVFIGLLTLLIWGGDLLSIVLSFSQKDIWWTPPKLAPSYQESRSRVQVYLKGEKLEAVLSSGSLSLAGKSGQWETVKPEDFRIRFNNWESRRASLFKHLSILTPFLTAGFFFLILGLFFEVRRKQKSGTDRD
ncbi:MAG: hypothetical protein PHQ23_14255 [Candidatus Wallbacteria bacterium]|nr:hypothetical protein [Candidatus Wallbacteria bacterium]